MTPMGRCSSADSSATEMYVLAACWRIARLSGGRPWLDTASGSASTNASSGRSERAERTLLVSEVNTGSRREKRRARRPRHLQRRALLRRLKRVTSQLERTREYRRSLKNVLELGHQLQSGLDAAQRERWLALEEALFDHNARLYRAYFCAGVEYGQHTARAPSASTKASAGAVAASAATHECPRGAVAPSALLTPGSRRTTTLERELLSALARWLGRLTRE